jgi:predicted enzyme related to lactoylglutathione lyase
VDLLMPDTTEARRFYCELFGWQFEESSGTFDLIALTVAH